MDKDRWGLKKTQRMQLKVWICLLGLLLIAILLFGKLILMFVHMVDGEKETKPRIPVIRVLSNVWIAEIDEDGLLIFRDGEREKYPYAVIAATEDGQELLFQPASSVREQVADVVLSDGKVKSITPKTTKINGKVLSADETGIEVEGYGWLPLAADYKGYRLFDSLEMCTVRDLFIGYNFADLCVENGEICGILMVKESAMEYIRVLIKSSDYSGNFHEQPVITCDVDFTVIYGDYENLQSESHLAGEEIAFSKESSYFAADRVWIVPDVLTGKVILKNCNRNQGIPSYRGHMELLKTENGIAVINEVLLEEYLYSVVPSEMPSNYPNEALKAQAICARTYAYGHMEHAGYPQYGAHVDDSTTYQVYNNISEQESTSTAVKETYGQLLFTESGSLAGTYYYSTSCGIGSDATVWKTEEAPTLTYLTPKEVSKTAMNSALQETSNEENLGEILKSETAFEAFIKTVDEDHFEAKEGWYRWTYQSEELDSERMLEMLKKRYETNNKLVLTWENGEYISKKIEKLDDVTDIYIEKRGGGGVADELVIETLSQKIKVISEHNIRYVLNNGESKVVRQDGSKIDSPNLLPSGYFVIETTEEKKKVSGYTLFGGGFGHGVGMSQNGAKEMAKSGYFAKDILLYFYEDCFIESIYE